MVLWEGWKVAVKVLIWTITRKWQLTSKVNHFGMLCLKSGGTCRILLVGSLCYYSSVCPRFCFVPVFLFSTPKGAVYLSWPSTTLSVGELSPEAASLVHVLRRPKWLEQQSKTSTRVHSYSCSVQHFCILSCPKLHQESV